MCKKPFYSPKLDGSNKGLKVIILIHFMKGENYLDTLPFCRYSGFQVQTAVDRWGGTVKKTD